jgi:TIR domain
VNQAIQHYSCFIMYSAKDQEFAERLHADLQNNGERCWFAPHDMPIGGKIRDKIDVAIRLRDKLLLILSEHSIKSNWVEDEIEQASLRRRTRARSGCAVSGPVGQNRPTGKRIGAGGAAPANAQKPRYVVYIARRRLITSPRNG